MSDLISANRMIKRLEEWNTNDDMDKALYNFAMNRVFEQPTVKAIQKEQIDNILKELYKKMHIAEKEMEDCTFKGMPFYDTANGYAKGIRESIEIIKRGVSNEID